MVRNWYETFYRNVLIVAILDDDDDAAILHSLSIASVVYAACLYLI